MTAENSGKAERGRQFKPGQSGNPGGRPKMPEEMRQILRAAGAELARKLLAYTEHSNPKIAMWAITEALDRAYGKPEVMSKVEMSGQIQPVVLFRWMTEEETSTMTAQNDKMQR